MRCDLRVLLTLGAFVGLASPALADTVMQQCGQQYQAAKAAGTLNGMTWNQYRSDCSARLKAQPAAATAAPAVAPAVAPAPAAAAAPVANPLNPAPAKTAAAPAPAPVAPAPAAAAPASTAATATPAAGTKTPSAGQTAFHERQKQCGAEWRANKTTLVAQTPGLTWPKYLSQCNTRLKAAGK